MNQTAAQRRLSVDWANGGRVESDAGDLDELHVKATHTLIETIDGGSGLSVLGTKSQGTQVRRVVMATGEVTSHARIEARQTIDVPSSTEPLSGLLLPLVAEIVMALGRVGLDPGWDGVVVGSDLRADLVLSLGSSIGARSLTAVRSRAGPEVLARDISGPVFDSDLEGWPEMLADHLAGRPGPVLALESTGVGRMVNATLAALPARSQIALFGPSAPAPVSVDFYRDVHAKNVTLVGVESRLEQGAISRALALVENRLAARINAEVRRVEAREGSTIPVGPERLVVVAWDPPSS